MAACSNPDSQAGAPLERDVPLLSDADIDQAVLRAADRLIALEVTENDVDLGGAEVDGFDGVTRAADITPLATLPDVAGYLAYVRYDAGHPLASWRVILANQATNHYQSIYGGEREIESAAASLDGNTIVFAMRLTTDPSSNFEIYRVTRTPIYTVERLTSTAYDESNVSISADGTVIAWEGEFGGVRSVVAREGLTESTLFDTDPLVQPSISGDGDHLSYVRHLTGGSSRIVLFDRTAETAQAIFTSVYPLEHPSPSDGGGRVAWLFRHDAFDQIRIRELATGDWFGVLYNPKASPSDQYIDHPHLTANGAYVTFLRRTDTDGWRVATRIVATGQAATVSSSNPPVTNRAPYWQMAGTPVSLSISGNVAHSTTWVSREPGAAAPTPTGGSFDAKPTPFVSAGASGIVVSDVSTEPDWVPGDWSTAIPYVHVVPDEVIVGFRTSLFSVQAFDAGALTANEVAVLNAELQATAGSFASDHGLSVLGTSPILSVALMRLAPGTTLVDALTALANDPRVAYVEPNGIYRRHQVASDHVEAASTHPTDPAYFGSQRWHYGYVGGPRAWDTQRGSDAVRVAVLDTGYRGDHPDAPGLIAPPGEQRDFIANSYVYTLCAGGSIPRAWDQSGYDDDATDWMQYGFSGGSNCATSPASASSHGTHVAGTIAAAWNGVGGVGLARNVRIIPIQVLDLVGSGTWYDVAQGVLYAGGLPADDGAGGTVSMDRADVANMSLGGAGGNITLADAVTAASNNGTLIIASAGNAGTSTLQYPAAYPEVVAVTSIGGNGVLAYYSSYGSWVEITAPGGDVFTAPGYGVYSATFNYTGCSTTPGVLCTTSNGGVANYANYQGTSMAAPHVAGIAALYLAQDPSLTREQLRQALRDRAFDWGVAGFDTYYGYGLAHLRPGVGVGLVTSSGPRRVELIDATTGATVQSVLTDAAGDYSFPDVSPGDYYVLAASNSAPTDAYGATGASISAYSDMDDGWFQGASVVTVTGASLTNVDMLLGWPGYDTSNDTPASAAFMHPGYYAEFTYDSTYPDRWYRVRVPTAGSYRIWTDGTNSPDRCGSGTIGAAANGFDDLDTYLEVFESDGTTLIDANDDAPGRGYCSDLTLNLTAGTYLVNVSTFGGADPALDGRRTILRFDPQ